MNRKERRKLGIKEKPKMIHMNRDQFDEILKERDKRAIDLAYIYMMCIPCWVIHDKFAKIMKKEEDGVCRVERFFDLCLESYEDFENGLYTIGDLQKTILEEAGFDLNQRFVER